MTSGYMVCPKCGKDFQYGSYEGTGLDLRWVVQPEPWKCKNCNNLVVLDKQKGYGLKLFKEAHQDD